MLTETRLSNQAIKFLKLQGFFAYKTSDRFQSGVPDIYICGGKWIESKLAKCSHNFTPIKQLRPEQRMWAEKLLRHGDHSYILTGCQFINPAYKQKPFYHLCKYEDGGTVVTVHECNLDLAEILLAFSDKAD